MIEYEVHTPWEKNTTILLRPRLNKNMEFADIYIAKTYDEILIPYVIQWNLSIAEYLHKMCVNISYHSNLN